MGMAASQARLLSLTSRLHDIEHKAQNIESCKIALATQKDDAYQAYCDALDATSIKVAYRNGVFGTNFVDANFSTLCNYDENRMMSYALRDNRSGMLLVSEEIYNNYDNYSNDKYAFAWAMLGYDGHMGWTTGYMDSDAWGTQIGIGTNLSGENCEYGEGNNIYMTDAEGMVYEAHKEEDSKLANLYEDIFDAETDSEKQKALDTFRDYLYSKYAKEIFEKINIDKQASNDKNLENPELVNEDATWGDIAGEFNYWVQIFEAIENCGGCQVIDAKYESGAEGNQWLNNMVAAGQVTIMVYNETGHKNEWSDTSVATSTNSNYLQDQQDEAAIKKAEVEYEHELDLINRKDTKFDTELSKLETERKAITTEMDSLKKVRDDNVDRTFGIFS